LAAAGVKPLTLDPKAGLALVNGDNFSTALACLLAVDTLQVLLISMFAGSLAVQVLEGSIRAFHPMLSDLRPHAGQAHAASIYRFLLDGSTLARQDMLGHVAEDEGEPIQDVYSLRCMAQYHAFNIERLAAIFDAIEINANSVSDNPLWVAPEHVVAGEQPWQWVSGGNFLAMYMAESIDSLRKIMTHIVKLNDRHLARLVQPAFNRGLTPNLSDPASVTQCAFKGVQIQSGMLDVYSSLLSMPVTTFFGTHEENNQDVTSHALTSGILGLENLRLARYSVAQSLLALAQAVDLRGGPRRLSPRTRPAYDFVRSLVKYVFDERPLSEDIEALYQSIRSGAMMRYLRREVLADYQEPDRTCDPLAQTVRAARVSGA
jgi:phenylalanine ammonia-lyase